MLDGLSASVTADGESLGLQGPTGAVVVGVPLPAVVRRRAGVGSIERERVGHLGVQGRSSDAEAPARYLAPARTRRPPGNLRVVRDGLPGGVNVAVRTGVGAHNLYGQRHLLVLAVVPAAPPPVVGGCVGVAAVERVARGDLLGVVGTRDADAP